MRKVLHFMDLLEDSDTEWMAARGTTSRIAAGTVLIREGEHPESVFVVLDGQLSVTAKAVGNKELATLFSGEVVGEMSFVSTHPPSASVAATSDSKVLRIPRDLLKEKLARDSAFAARFYHAIAAFLSDRLQMTVSRFGYGAAGQDDDPTELDDESMDRISLAASRFDGMLRRLQRV